MIKRLAMCCTLVLFSSCAWLGDDMPDYGRTIADLKEPEIPRRPHAGAGNHDRSN